TEAGDTEAGDGNRTRTVSLGSPIRASTHADLWSGVSASDRGRPYATGVNGTLMARQSCGGTEMGGRASLERHGGTALIPARPCLACIRRALGPSEEVAGRHTVGTEAKHRTGTAAGSADRFREHVFAMSTAADIA